MIIGYLQGDLPMKQNARLPVLMNINNFTAKKTKIEVIEPKEARNKICLNVE